MTGDDVVDEIDKKAGEDAQSELLHNASLGRGDAMRILIKGKL